MMLQTLLLRSTLFGILLLLVSMAGSMVFAANHPMAQQPQNLVLNQHSAPIALGRYLQYQVAGESDSNTDPLELQNNRWQQGTTDTINLGYKPHPYWFRTHWQTDVGATGNWILEIANSQIDSIDIYIYEDDLLLRHWHTGDALPYDQRPIDHPFFVFPLELKNNAHYQLYILVKNTEAMELPVKLMRQHQYTHSNTVRAWIDGIFNGFLIIMAAYSLALFVILRDKTYLFYVSYIFSMLLFFLFQQGMLYPLLFPSWPGLQHHIISFISLYIFFSIAFFFRELLELPTQLPKHWLMYKALLILHGIYCLLFWVLDYQTTMYLMVVNTALSTLVAIVSITQLALRGSRSAQIVLVGWALLLFFLIVFTAAKTGFLYNEFMATYGLRIGISFEILIFSFALSFRINLEREAKELALQEANQERTEKLQAQELALQREIEANHAKEKALRIEIQHRENLERLVEERTVDLERTLSELEKSNQELELLSCKDGLTGVYNRRAFDRRLEECWKLAQRNQATLSLLIIDIDHFKQINDRRGHLCGDYVLRDFAELLNRILQRPTDFIARYGGEEFAVLLTDTPLTGAETIADNIVRRAAAHAFEWNGERFQISVSVGVNTRSNKPGADEKTLLALADNALYQAKHEGRNRWISAQQ